MMIKYKNLVYNFININFSGAKCSLVAKRKILSAAYECHDDWSNRLHSPILSNIKTSEFLTKLKEKHDSEKRIDAIDIDILANKLEDLESYQLDFAEELFYNFRHTEDAVDVIDSTPHALLRNLMLRGEDERIFRMLQDKVHYGIFLDTFSANLLFNYFIKKNDIAKGAQIAYDLMHQEDRGNELTENLVFHVSYQRLLQLPLNAEPRLLPNQAEMEVKYKKVNYIPPVWYDDHFDLPNEHAKLGRTLQMMVWGKKFNPVLRGLEIVGLALGLKFEEALQKIEEISDNENEALVASQLVEHFEKMLLDIKPCEKMSEIEPGLLRLIHLYPYITEEQKNSFILQFQELKTKLLSSNKLTDINVSDEINNWLNLAAQEYQSRDIQDQKKLYQNWVSERERLVQRQVDEHRVSTTKRNLAERLVDLTRTEERLRFFEEHESIEMALDVARKVREKQVDLKMKEEEEVFVLPPGERKSAADAIKKKKKKK